MTDREALIGLNLSGCIGARRLALLLQEFKSPQDILGASFSRLTRVDRIGEKSARQIAGVTRRAVDEELARAREEHVSICTLYDPDYPAGLKNIPDPPLVLYVKGNIVKEDILSIAVVGSRRASFYGLSCAGNFAAGLSRLGLTIVSGLARGIDTAAHQGALRQGGRTIAVMGSGLGCVYPAENRKLAERIAAQGAVVSEFPVCTEPFKQNFPRRNRIISGLSLGVLVVEAAQNSGALITADCALEQGREVFALPGKIDSSTSFGTHELIKQGAKLVSSAEEIITELNIPLTNPAYADKIGGKTVRPQSPRSGVRSEGERFICGLIGKTPVSLDEILGRARAYGAAAYRILADLEIQRHIKQLPGKLFVKNTHEE